MSSEDTYLDNGQDEESQQTLNEESSPTTQIQEKAELEAMNRELSQMILKMNKISAQGLILNVDIVSQFDPAVIQELNELMEDCEACTARINKKMEEAHKCLNGSQSSDNEEKGPQN